MSLMRQYIALIHKDADSDFGVSFPDLPGCVTAGFDLDDARRMAEEALALHLAGMAEDDEPIPEPSSLEAVMAERENRDAVAILVKGPPATAKAVRVNMTIPEDDLEQIDKFAAEQGYTRSGFLVHAAKQAIGEATARPTPKERRPTQFETAKMNAYVAANARARADALAAKADYPVYAALMQLSSEILDANTMEAIETAQRKGDALQKAIDAGLTGEALQKAIAEATAPSREKWLTDTKRFDIANTIADHGPVVDLARAETTSQFPATVYIEARPRGRQEGEPIEDYVVEDDADHVLKVFKTQKEAIDWAKKEGHHPLVARVRHENNKTKPRRSRREAKQYATLYEEAALRPRSKDR
jgi:predicted RNase H-like HicB family nuclease